MIRVYGIRQCDTCRKTLKWLECRALGFEFRDLREAPVGAVRLRRWLAALGAEKLINRRSATWRQLDSDQRARALGAGAAELLAAHPTLIKRPLVEQGSLLTVGFRPDAWGAN